jgi:hypothetical protein
MERIKLDVLDRKAMYFLKKLEANKMIHIVRIHGDAEDTIENNEVASFRSIEEIELLLKESNNMWN